MTAVATPAGAGTSTTGTATSWGMLETAADGRIVACNACFAGWSGRSLGELLGGLRLKDVLSAPSRILHETHYVPLLAAQGYANEVAFDLAAPDGRRFPVLVCAVRRHDAATTTALSVFDATETRRHERALVEARRGAEAAAGELERSNRALHAQKEQLRVTLRSIADAVVTLDARRRVTSMNPTAERLLGIAEAAALGARVGELGTLRPVGEARRDRRAGDPPGQAAVARFVLRRRDGSERHVALTVAPILGEDRAVGGTVLVCRDVTDEQAAVARLEHDAAHDHLTGLPNRREFDRRLASARGTPGSSHAVCHLDLDQFKIVNDTAGHAAGDRLLVEVAELLRARLRQSDSLARLGGDEFGILLAGCPLPAGLQIAEDLRQQLAAHRFDWHGRSHAVTASIGVSLLRADDDAGAAGALTDADLACNAAKERGRNRVHGVEPGDLAMQSRRGEMGWVARIQRALDDDLFELHYQPIVPLGRHSSMQRGEILLRLREADGTLLGPAAFIAAAERYSQMAAIDRWVARKAFEWLVGVPRVMASVNLSGQSLGDAGFLAYVTRLFESTGLAPSRVCFEITETAAIADLPAALRFIRELRGRGSMFALDDFGSGLSSFAYLKTLPVDCVKIDGSFVKAMAADVVSREIVESINRIAGLCGMKTVAECVEDDATVQALRDIGIDYAQGWRLGRPRPIEDVGTPRQAGTLLLSRSRSR